MSKLKANMPYQLQEVDSIIKELSKYMMVLHACMHIKITNIENGDIRFKSLAEVHRRHC